MKKSLIVLFFCFIGVIGLLNVLVEDRVFSEHENRKLAQRPIFTFESFLSGEYTSEFEEYINDQFIAKKFWGGLKAKVERLMLKKDNNGIYWGDNQFLLEGTLEPTEQLEKNITSLQAFVTNLKGIETYVLLAPTSVEIYKENLPLFAHSYSQKEIMNTLKTQLDPSIKVIDVIDYLSDKKGENIYFRTDHHWTMRGAYYAYQKAAKSLGLTYYELDDFQVGVVSDNFFGTFQSKTNDFFITPDKIELFVPKFEVKYEVNYSGEKDSATTLFAPSYLNQKDQYSFFLNGNHSLLKITSSIQNGRKIAIIKDSYANAFIPFLANHYEEIHVIDLRYYPLSVSDYMEENNLEQCLILYNIVNFTKDENLFWLRK